MYPANLAGIPDASSIQSGRKKMPDGLHSGSGSHEKSYRHEFPSEKKRGFFFVYRLGLVIRERLGAEALDEAADLGDLSGAVADVDARRGRERVVRVGALEEQVAEDAMRGGLH